VLFRAARHPYTKALIKAAPEADRHRRLDLHEAAHALDGLDDGSTQMVEVAPGHRAAIARKDQQDVQAA
jgi:ABC-type dipeptide/oligopeptide/nickel transport system ATPase component